MGFYASKFDFTERAKKLKKQVSEGCRDPECMTCKRYEQTIENELREAAATILDGMVYNGAASKGTLEEWMRKTAQEIREGIKRDS